MNNLEFQFDHAFKSLGGIENGIWKNIPFVKDLLSLLAVEVEVLRKGEKNLPPIYLDLIGSMDFNAFSAKSGEQYFIGICTGAIIHSFDIFSRMLSANTILPYLGNVAKEAPPQKVYDIQFKHINGNLSFFSRALIPKDIVRQEVVSVFMKYLLEFLVIHEYAHIIYGHVGYHAANQTTIEKDVFACQVMEASADSFATFAALQPLLSTNDLRPDMPVNLLPYYKDLSTRLKMWLFPIYTYFRLFGFSNRYYSLERDIYPPPSCRANMLMDMMNSVVTELLHLEDTELLVNTACDAIMEVEGAFDEVTEWGLDFTASRYGFSDEVVAHTRKIMDHLSNLDELLKDYTHIAGDLITGDSI